MGWIRIKGGGYNIRDTNKYDSTCQLEIDVKHTKDIEQIENKGEYNLIAPLRLFSFDIECSAQKGFP